MKLCVDDMRVLADIATQAAIEAGGVIKEYAGRSISVDEKVAGSTRASQVVTEVDFLSQEVILGHLVPTCEKYDFALLSEERPDDPRRFEKDYFWCIDPLDGTLPFVEGRPGYSVSIALVSRNGESCIGVVYAPLEEILYTAIKGGGVLRNRKRWEWHSQDSDTSCAIDSGGAVMNACWVLEKQPACFYKKPKQEDGGGCVWDYAATACLFEEVGAWVSDIYGKPLELNRKESLFMNHRGVIYASNNEIARTVVRDQT